MQLCSSIFYSTFTFTLMVAFLLFKISRLPYIYQIVFFNMLHLISPTHKRTEGRAPVWGSEFTSKRRRTTGGDPAETAVG
jgi:hypothetical protein